MLPRHAALKAGIPAEVDGYAIDMLCSSGMMSTMNGDTAIRAGDADLVLVGGIESMSQAGFVLSARARWGYKLLIGGNTEQLQDALLVDGLTDPMTGELMGEETERLCAAHERHARRAGRGGLSVQLAAPLPPRPAASWPAEIAPIDIQERKKTIVFATTRASAPTRPWSTLAALRPAFGKDGVLTAGNSSQLSDGAAALVLASEKAVKEYGLKPMAKILGGAWAGVEPWRFVEGPVPAIRKLMKKLDTDRRQL